MEVCRIASDFEELTDFLAANNKHEIEEGQCNESTVEVHVHVSVMSVGNYAVHCFIDSRSPRAAPKIPEAIAVNWINGLKRDMSPDLRSSGECKIST